MKIISHSVGTIVYDKVSRMLEITAEENETNTEKTEEDSLVLIAKQVFI